MSLVVFNGSPRGKKSNSTVISNWFIEGYTNHDYTVKYLNRISEQKSLAESAGKYDELLFVFPLYVDGMPGQVKNFFELLIPYKDELKNKKVTFIIHSGFSEAIQSRALEQYLNGFSDNMGLKNHGVIIIPGSEGFKLMPSAMTAKKREAIIRLAKEFERETEYNSSDLSYLRSRESYSFPMRILFRAAALLGLTNMYWNSNLKKNNAYKERFAAPYLNKPVKITSKAYLSNLK